MCSRPAAADLKGDSASEEGGSRIQHVLACIDLAKDSNAYGKEIWGVES
jgi:hypothetical protein